MKRRHLKSTTYLLLIFIIQLSYFYIFSNSYSLPSNIKDPKAANPLRNAPFSTFFNNPYDYADAESYGTNLFNSLLKHMNEVKRLRETCPNIPLPKTVLAKKYFNPAYDFMQYKFWYPPKDFQHVVLWSQYEAYRSSLFYSYMLQDENAKFPPGWLYMYLSTAAQLHALQTIGYNSHRSVKAIKLPFESNEVFKVNWWTNGNYQKFEKPFALYATQPKPNDMKLVRVIDFGTGNYSDDYTGHAFLGNYIYERQQFLLNNTYEFSNFWRRPYNHDFNNYNYGLNFLGLNTNLGLNKVISPTDPEYQRRVELNQHQKYQENLLLQQQQQQLLHPQYPVYKENLPYDPSNYVNSNQLPYDRLPVAGVYPQYPTEQPYMQQLPAQGPQPYATSLTDNTRFYPYFQQMNLQGQYLQQQLSMNQMYQQQSPYHGPYLPFYQHKPITSLNQFTPFIYVNKNNVPITSWDPIIDNDRNNLNRVPDKNSPIGFDQWYINSIVQNTALESLKSSNENPFILKNLTYIESYRYAKVWWSNETDKDIVKNIQEYVFRIKPEERYYKFFGAKYEGGTSWSAPYFWCQDPTNWLVTAKAPIWATNDQEYRNKFFINKNHNRFVGLSEVVLNYEELDVNQCPGDRTLNAFSSTSLCDSTADCLPLTMYGLTQGGYECQCVSGYHYPSGFQGPFKGKELGSADAHSYPLCTKSEDLLQYPNWISKNAVEYRLPDIGTSPSDENFKHYVKKRSADDNKGEKLKKKKKSDVLLDGLNNQAKKKANEPKKRTKRFLDKRNNFEKLRDAIFGDQTYLRRKCLSMPFQDIIRLNEDDERFINSLRLHANMAFKPQVAQAVRIAHILSAYLQLHSPISKSSVNSQNDYSSANNMGTILRPDPQLEEHYVVGEIMSTLLAHFPLQEVSVFFNGTEFTRQKFFAGQNVLSIGLTAIRSDIEVFLNRTNDNSHLTKTWYLDAVNRFQYGGDKTIFGGYYQNDIEKNYYQSAGPYDSSNLQTNFKYDRFAIEMSLRKSFDGLLGNVDVPAKYYDAPTSGVWYGPYYDCQKRYMKTKTTLRMSYSVPIITGMNKLPIGFVSVVVGSDLKWWRINPCDTSKDRNMFQGLHRCDPETSMCVYQEVPDFENGYYLASYKCVCKANYEFPFIDYGSSYFEGATVEKEYDKKVKGQPNIYDRLKCRPITLRSLYGRKYWNTSDSIRVHQTKSSQYFILAAIFLLGKILYIN